MEVQEKQQLQALSADRDRLELERGMQQQLHDSQLEQLRGAAMASKQGADALIEAKEEALHLEEAQSLVQKYQGFIETQQRKEGMLEKLLGEPSCYFEDGRLASAPMLKTQGGQGLFGVSSGRGAGAGAWSTTQSSGARVEGGAGVPPGHTSLPSCMPDISARGTEFLLRRSAYVGRGMLS